MKDNSRPKSIDKVILLLFVVVVVVVAAAPTVAAAVVVLAPAVIINLKFVASTAVRSSSLFAKSGLRCFSTR